MAGDLTASHARYPRIRVSGSPRERGRQYGEGARLQVQRSLQAYEHPFGICCRPDPRTASVHDQAATVVSMVMNLDRGEISASDGHPCEEPLHELGCAGFLAGRRSVIAEGAGR